MASSVAPSAATVATPAAAPAAAAVAAPAAAPSAASLAAALDLDAADQITSVRLDGLALTKIVKHSRDAHPADASGTLLGLEIGGVLEVSNVFALPNVPAKSSDKEEGDDDKKARNTTRYSSEMVRLLRDVNADANVVGLYQGCFLGAFLSSAVIDSLAQVAGLMEREGASGKGRGVLLVHDLAQSAQGNTVIKAYRLSQAFIEAHRKGKFHAQSLIDHKLTFNNILTEIPVSLHNTALMDAFLSTLSTPSVPAPSILPPTTASLLRAPPSSALPPNHTSLTLALEPVLASALEGTLDALDEHAAEAGNVGFLSRQLARERARADAYVARRKAENAAREAQGLAPLPQEDIARMFKLPAEPSRLESTLLLGQLDDSARRLVETAGVGAMQLYAARTGAA